MKTIIKAELVRATDKAILVRIEGKEVWMPQSAARFISADQLEVADWMMKKIGAERTNSGRKDVMTGVHPDVVNQIMSIVK